MKRAVVPPIFTVEVEPGEAIKIALKVRHPFAIPAALPPGVDDAIGMLCRDQSLAVRVMDVRRSYARGQFEFGSLERLAKRAKDGVRKAGGFPIQFGTISVSDGISMGHEGMRGSLVSREVICDSVETVVFAERLDGFVGLAGCDKSLPGMMMAAARLEPDDLEELDVEF